jgi:glycosyltransferase involved in cell wall biosynthesis
MSGSQKRLAILVPDMTPGGAERATLNLVQGVARHGYTVDLVLARAVGSLLAEVPESVRVVDLKASRALASLPALVRYLRRERPHTLYSVLNHTNIVALWARRLAGVPTRAVVSVRNTLSSSAQHASSWGGRLMPQLIRSFYPWADRIVTVSKGVADDLAQVTGIPRERIQAIYNPVVTPKLREKARAPLDHPCFPTLIRAYALARQARLARLLILGQGTEQPALEALISSLGLEQDVSLPGFVPNPYPYMTRASLFVLSSRWEGLPGVLIEALYCGPLLIATDCPSGPREILADGKYGQLVPVGDAAALAQAIETALAGGIPGPPPESWQPFELETVMNQFINVLLGD